MFEELEYEFSQFKNDFDNGGLVFGRYFDEDDYWIMARYSTEAKAKRAMEMLYEKYIETSQWYSEVAHRENNYPKVFQFPSDEEIEVT